MGHPTADQLLEAVALFLREAEGALAGRQAFHAKVAGNALEIVRRELAQRPDDAEAAALEPWGGAAALCERLRDGRARPDDPALLRALTAAAVARLAVDNPRYSTLPRLKELADADARHPQPPA